MNYICSIKDCTAFKTCMHGKKHNHCGKLYNYKNRIKEGYACGYCVDITKERNEKLKKIQENI